MANESKGELKSLSQEELTQKVQELKKQLLDLRMQASSGKLDKPHRVREVRREIARLLTWIHQKA